MDDNGIVDRNQLLITYKKKFQKNGARVFLPSNIVDNDLHVFLEAADEFLVSSNRDMTIEGMDFFLFAMITLFSVCYGLKKKIRIPIRSFREYTLEVLFEYMYRQGFLVYTPATLETIFKRGDENVFFKKDIPQDTPFKSLLRFKGMVDRKKKERVFLDQLFQVSKN